MTWSPTIKDPLFIGYRVNASGTPDVTVRHTQHAEHAQAVPLSTQCGAAERHAPPRSSLPQLPAHTVQKVHLYTSPIKHTWDPSFTTYKASLACEWALVAQLRRAPLPCCRCAELLRSCPQPPGRPR